MTRLYRDQELADVLDKVNALADENNLTIMNVFHAGDGNLHPLLVFDASEEGTLDRVHQVAAEIVKISLEAGEFYQGAWNRNRKARIHATTIH